MDDPNAGSGETLTKAANLIYRGKSERHSEPRTGAKAHWGKIKSSMMESAELEPESKSTPVGNWNKLRMAINVASAADYKKKEVDGPPVQVDPEMGNMDDDDSSELDYLDDGDEGNEGSLHKKRLKAAMEDGLLSDFNSFLGQQRTAIGVYLKVLVFIMIPALALSCLLFYVAGNPPTGVVDTTSYKSRL